MSVFAGTHTVAYGAEHRLAYTINQSNNEEGKEKEKATEGRR